MLKRAFLGLGALLLVLVLYVSLVWLGWLGQVEHAGQASAPRRDPKLLESEQQEQREQAQRAGIADPGLILFGDLHVHTTFSADAFAWSLPLLQGSGAHPPADACDFARVCSALDFWSINDHAESLTPRRWKETLESVRQCNAIGDDNSVRDTMAFAGWEWTQVGRSPADHYGHKNVIFKDLDPERLPTRPIAAGGKNFDAFRSAPTGASRLLLPALDLRNRQRYYDLDLYLRETAATPLCESGVDVRALPDDCAERADTPRELFEKLDQWGYEALVIPHGTSWGSTAPRGATWAPQLRPEQKHGRQQLNEVYSGHGNSEEYRSWRGAEIGTDGAPRCPAPSADYTPACWQAGEIVRARCIDTGLERDECERRIAEARANHVRAGIDAVKTIPGQRQAEWLDAGQCRDCFLPAFNYRPGLSAQAALASRHPERHARFRFGLIASSDNHAARPGTGYKEFGRVGMTDQRGVSSERVAKLATPAAAEPRSIPPEEIPPGLPDAERMASFWLTGGLVGVHAREFGREQVWDALQRREVYGTSGPRILLWFDLLSSGRRQPMGSQATLSNVPRFSVRALGARRQQPGCPDALVEAVGRERIEKLCMNECYNPSNTRHVITRLEVVRIRPQQHVDEPLEGLIEDPWRVHECPGKGGGCTLEFSDDEFEATGRDTVYYVRAIQQESEAVNAANLRCERDSEGACVKTRPCSGGYLTADDDDCLAPTEERAWSSPIFVDYRPRGS